jgi:starvation-inducible outer membrane lipoprotein
MKKAMLAAAITLLAACSTLPDSIKGPFARAAQGASTTDTVDQPAATSPFPAVTDKGLF